VIPPEDGDKGETAVVVLEFPDVPDPKVSSGLIVSLDVVDKPDAPATDVDRICAAMPKPPTAPPTGGRVPLRCRSMMSRGSGPVPVDNLRFPMPGKGTSARTCGG
jgi:hypothetical protein